MRAIGSALILGVSALALMGCTEPNPGYWGGGPGLPGECRVGEEVLESFEDFERPEKVDLLLMVANSGEVSGYQEALSRSLPSFLADLESDGLDLQVAVMTADAEAEGVLAPAVDSGEGCGGNDLQVARSGEKDWTKVVACNVRQGSRGSARQQPLAILTQALVEEPALLSEFRREQARLVILVVSAQDDCSGWDWQEGSSGSVRDQCAWRADDLAPAQDYVEALKQTAVVPEGISMAVIGGPSVDITYEEGTAVRPVCSSTLGSAYPSPRLTSATRAFGDEGLFLSSCTLDFYGHLEEIRQRLMGRDFITLCPSEVMAHEPLEVRGEFAGGQVRPLPYGAGFVLRGPDEGCEEGAVQLQREAIQSLKRLEIRYCARL